MIGLLSNTTILLIRKTIKGFFVVQLCLQYCDNNFTSFLPDLFELRFKVPVNSFSVMSGQSLNQYYGELMCLAEGHNTVPQVGIKFGTSRFRVRCFTTMHTALPLPDMIANLCCQAVVVVCLRSGGNFCCVVTVVALEFRLYMYIELWLNCNGISSIHCGISF